MRRSKRHLVLESILCCYNGILDTGSFTASKDLLLIILEAGKSTVRRLVISSHGKQKSKRT
jgi:hypothetical protein